MATLVTCETALSEQQARDGDSAPLGMVTGERIHQGAESWYAKPVHRSGAGSGAFTSKNVEFRFDGGAGSAEQATAARFSAEASGKSNVGGWVGGIDVNVGVHPSATADKIYGAASYMQFGTGAKVTKALGFEPVINHLADGAKVDNYVGFYFPNISHVIGQGKIDNIYSFVSEQAGAPIRNYGPFYRTNSADQVQELAPSAIGVLTSLTQWCVGRLGFQPASPAELPAGFMAVGAIYLPTGGRITDLGVVISNGSAGNGKLAIYRQSQHGAVGVKVWQSSQFSVNASGHKNVKPSLDLESGLYLVTFVANTPVGVASRPSAMANTIFGTLSPTDEGCVPVYSLGGFPSNLPDDLSSVQPATLTQAFFPEFTFKVAK